MSMTFKLTIKTHSVTYRFSLNSRPGQDNRFPGGVREEGQHHLAVLRGQRARVVHLVVSIADYSMNVFKCLRQPRVANISNPTGRHPLRRFRECDRTFCFEMGPILGVHSERVGEC